RVYEDPAGAERSWPLSYVPLLIDAAEWEALKAGLAQRAALLEAVLADVYGPAELIGTGRLPATLIAGNPEFLRPLAGVVPAGGAHPRFCAVDLRRSAEGKGGVVGGRTPRAAGARLAVGKWACAGPRAARHLPHAARRAARAILPGPAGRIHAPEPAR